MNTKQQVWASVVAIGLGLGASYALAEKNPPADKNAAAAEGASCEGEHGGKSCCDHHECKHGDHECMHGDHDGAMSCPMMGLDRPALDATVENTAGGAVIRLTAKNPSDAAKVQAMATKIAAHLGAAAGAASHPAAAPAATMKAAPKH